MIHLILDQERSKLPSERPCIDPSIMITSDDDDDKRVSLTSMGITTLSSRHHSKAFMHA
jgi:hypothetical protein